MEVKKTLNIIPLLIVLNVFYAVYALVKDYYSVAQINNSLISLLPVFLGLNLGILILFIAINKIKADKRVLLIAVIIFLLAFSLRAAAPQTHRLFFDEDIYINVGQNIAHEGRAILCNRGENTCLEGVLNKQPHAHPFLSSVVFFLFGVNELYSFWLNVVLASASAVVMFLLAKRFFKSEKVGIVAGVMFSLLPLHIAWSNTICAEIPFVFFSLLSALFLLEWIEKKGYQPGILFGASLAFAAQFRPEAFLLLVVFLFGLLCLKKGFVDFIFTKQFVLVSILVLFLIFPTILQLGVASETDNWGSQGNMFGWEYASKNFTDNFWFFFENSRWPVVYTMFAIAGLIYGIGKKENKALFFLFWLGVFFIIYMFFYAGSFNYGVDDRFAMTLFAPMVLLSMFTFDYMFKNLKIKKTGLLALVIIILFVLYAPFYSYSHSIGPKAGGARYQHDFVYSVKDDIPENCYLMTHVPSLFLHLGFDAMQTWYGQNNAVMEHVFSRTDCVLFLEGYWCGSEPYKSGICDYMHEHYKLSLWKRAPKEVENRDYTIWKIDNL